jgi:hypothetical protein
MKRAEEETREDARWMERVKWRVLESVTKVV